MQTHTPCRHTHHADTHTMQTYTPVQSIPNLYIHATSRTNRPTDRQTYTAQTDIRRQTDIHRQTDIRSTDIHTYTDRQTYTAQTDIHSTDTRTRTHTHTHTHTILKPVSEKKI